MGLLINNMIIMWKEISYIMMEYNRWIIWYIMVEILDINVMYIRMKIVNFCENDSNIVGTMYHKNLGESYIETIC